MDKEIARLGIDLSFMLESLIITSTLGTGARYCYPGVRRRLSVAL